MPKHFYFRKIHQVTHSSFLPIGRRQAWNVSDASHGSAAFNVPSFQSDSFGWILSAPLAAQLSDLFVQFSLLINCGSPIAVVRFLADYGAVACT